MEDFKIQTKPASEFSEKIEEVEGEKFMKDFYNKFFGAVSSEKVKKISLEDLKELKEKGITTEKFLDYLCKNYNFLLHGSITNIHGEKLKSRSKQIFASNNPVIAIMKSLYSNKGVDLRYPYFIKNSFFKLTIKTSRENGTVESDKGFVYVVGSDGFANKPEGSWQFIKEDSEVPFCAVFEIEKEDFKHTVEYSKV